MSNKHYAAEQSFSGQDPSRRPVRRVVRPTGAAFRGRFPSAKSDHPVSFESLLERDALLLLEFSPGVLTYREQPLFTFYPHNGRMRKYTPDFEVTFVDGATRLIEVKPAYKLLDAEEAGRLTCLADHFRRWGTDFQVLSETEIRRSPDLLANLRSLMPYRAYPVAPLQQRLAIEQLGTRAPVSLADATARLNGRHAVMQLIAHNVLVSDLEQPLTAETMLHPVNGERRNELRYF
ncbi:TnsA endonuclease N-terminal domain-containing protein [Paraburkholderia kururiensis]|uniref:TnsA endonuclease N-terminal domain-containing protein n=1 Tax=Paraburkholderia kururiensis TaxID=984307 RepID=UPI000F85BF91|nr:TnsA endonuclease N-terminal domain-containing protein [Paraburkholderia kururiensis]